MLKIIQFPNSKLKHIKKLHDYWISVSVSEYQLFEETCYKDIAFGPKTLVKQMKKLMY